MKNHTLDYTVRLDDLDFMNIVGHTQWLVILERARVELFTQLGLSFKEMVKQGIGVVVSQLQMKYLRPAAFEQSLKISITPEALTQFRLMLHYRVTSETPAPHVIGKVMLVFINRENKPIPIPFTL